MSVTGEIRRHSSSTPAGGSWSIRTSNDGTVPTIWISGGSHEDAWSPLDIAFEDVSAFIKDIDAAVAMFERDHEQPAVKP